MVGGAGGGGGGGGDGDGASCLIAAACGANAGSVASLALSRSLGGGLCGGDPDTGEASLEGGRSPAELGVRGSPDIASLSFPHSSPSPEIEKKWTLVIWNF